METPSGEGISGQGSSLKEAKVSFGLSVLIVILLLALIGLAILILQNYYQQEQPKTPQDYEVQRWQSVVKANPKDPAAHVSLGFAYQQTGKLKEAEKEYLIALKLDEKNIGALYNLGLIYNVQKKLDEAISRFEEIVEQDPAHALTWYQMGTIRMKQENHKEAIVCFQNALQAEPAYANIHYELGAAYEKLGEKDKARQEYDITLQFLPNHREAKKGLERLK